MFVASPSLLLRILGEASLWFNLQFAVIFPSSILIAISPVLHRSSFFLVGGFNPSEKY